MKRRDFLKHGFLAASGLAAAPGLLQGALAHPKDHGRFSIHLLTNEPDRAIAQVQALIQEARLGHNMVRFEEFQMAGLHTGDLVFIKDNTLVNYRTSGDTVSRQLSEIASSFDLPRPIENPVMLKFASPGNSSKPKHLNIFRQNVMHHQIELFDEQGEFEITGATGAVVVKLRDGNVQIVSASCKHRTCMSMGNISKPGETLVCVPNQIRMAIDGESEAMVDGVAF